MLRYAERYKLLNTVKSLVRCTLLPIIAVISIDKGFNGGVKCCVSDENFIKPKITRQKVQDLFKSDIYHQHYYFLHHAKEIQINIMFSILVITFLFHYYD